MGNSSSPVSQSNDLITRYWQPIKGNLFKNKTTHQVIIQKKIILSSQQQMKYVFDCLLKRMNNYNINVKKIIYLRKVYQNNSICECGKKFVILVYLENVQDTLETFLKDKYYFQVKGGQGSGNVKELRDYTNNHTNKQIKIHKKQAQTLQERIRYRGKCVCLQILNGVKFLQQRYGYFKVSQKTIWIQICKTLQNDPSGSIVMNQGLHNLNYSSNLIQKQKQKQQQTISIKIKTWISQFQQQNFPDQVCDQRQMCMSILNLLNKWLIVNGICKCYQSELEIGHKQQQYSNLKKLIQKIKRDHQTTNTMSFSKVEHVQSIPFLKGQNINKQQQRTIRSFSSNIQSNNNNDQLNDIFKYYQNVNNTQKNNNPYLLPNNSYKSTTSTTVYNHNSPHIARQAQPFSNNDNHRKYSSIQYVRRSPFNQNQFTINSNNYKKINHHYQPNQPYQVGKYVSSSLGNSNNNNMTGMNILNRTTTNNSNSNDIKQIQEGRNKKNISYFVEKTLQQQQHNSANMTGKNIQFNLIQKNQTTGVSEYYQKGNQRFNPKIKFRHGNNLVNKPLTTIGSQHNSYNNSQKVSVLVLNSNNNYQQTQSNHQQQQQMNPQKPHLPVGNNYRQQKQYMTDRIIEIPNFIQQKQPNITDRTKIDSSSKYYKQYKDCQKKSSQAINSSRNNISITPISLQSTYGAASSLKPLDISRNLIKKEKLVDDEGELGLNVLSSHASKQTHKSKHSNKKQSGSSSKSQQGHMSYQIVNFGSNRQQNLNKRMSSQFQQQSLSSSLNLLEQSIQKDKQKQKQKIPAFLNKSDRMKKQPKSTIPIIYDNQLGRLRQSEYVQSNQSSVINSKQQSKRQSIEQSLQQSNQSIKQSNMSIQQQVKSIRHSRQSQQSILKSNSLKSSGNAALVQKLTSLAEMQAKFVTVQEILPYNKQQQQQNNNQLPKSQSSKPLSQSCWDKASQQLNQLPGNVNEVKNSQQVQSLQQKIVINIKKQEQSKIISSQTMFYKYHTSSQPLQEQLQTNPSKPPKIAKFGKISQTQQISLEGQKTSSFIMRQQQQPVKYVIEQEYKIKISISQQNLNPSPKSGIKNHTKKLSNNQHDKNSSNTMSKNKSLKQQFSNLLDFPKQNSFTNKAKSQNKEIISSLDDKEGRQTYSIYNQSEYNNSENASKRQSHRDVNDVGNPPLPKKKEQAIKTNKERKPIVNLEVQNPGINNKDLLKKQAQTLLRLTSSGHEDNSIKQKVRNKKAQFAQLKNQMNSLLL